MVGYIGDALLKTQVRVRFDMGVGVDAVDRAEFFYAKCGCYRDLPRDHPGFDPAAPGPGPGVVTDLDYQQLYVLGEFAVRDRVSFFAELPVRWLRPQLFAPGTGSFGDQTGLSDIRAGVKVGLAGSADRAVTLLFQAIAPTGDAGKGLGTDHWSVEPALLYYQRLGDRAGLESQFGVVLPTDGSAGVPTSTSDKFSGKVLYYGIGPSVDVYSSDRVRFGPVVELVGWRVLDGFQTAAVAEAKGINVVNLKIGARFVFEERSSFYIGYGHALTDAVWYDAIVRAEYRYSF